MKVQISTFLHPTEEDDNLHRAVDDVSKLSNGIPAMSSSLDEAHTRDNNDRTAVATRRLISFVDYSQFCMFSHKTSHKPAKNNPVVKENTTQSNAPRDETKMNQLVLLQTTIQQICPNVYSRYVRWTCTSYVHRRCCSLIST